MMPTMVSGYPLGPPPARSPGLHRRTGARAGRGRGRHHPPSGPGWRIAGRITATGLVLLAGAAIQAGPTAQPLADAETERPPVVRTEGGYAAESHVEQIPIPDGALPAGVVPAALLAPEPAAQTVRAVPMARGIPVIVLDAYWQAVRSLTETRPDCHLPLALLAAIGKVESNHARGGQVDAGGTTLTPILGPVLDGTGPFAAIEDTDGGHLDGNPHWDRAVGPMQFIPGTWARWRSDANRDGRADPHNVFDAGQAAGGYLCATGGDLSTEDGAAAAILRYNRSKKYLDLVLAWEQVYASAGITGLPAPAEPAAPAAPPSPPPPSTTVSVPTTTSLVTTPSIPSTSSSPGSSSPSVTSPIPTTSAPSASSAPEGSVPPT